MPAPKGKLVTPVGFDSSDDPRSLEVDADDALRVALETAAKGLVGLHGWIGGAWHKNPILLGYSGIYAERYDETQANGGDMTFTSTPVPAGEVHVVNFLYIQHSDPVSRAGSISADHGGVKIPVYYNASIAQWFLGTVSTNIVLEEDDFIEIILYSMANTKVGYGGYWATRVDVDL